MEWIYRRWERRSDYRYYEAHLKKDLFGWVIVKNWGGINRATGNQITLPCDTYEEGLLKLKEVEKLRAGRNYVPVSS